MGKKYRILYVDDEIDNLKAFKAVFRREYEITTVSSGKEALAVSSDQEFDIVISDQRMPSMTGVELFEKLRATTPNSIRMILTGYTEMQSIVDAINKGNIYYYISKPWNAEDVRVIINNAIETYQLRARNRELEKENVKAQLATLKNQINPHFLFNSMNILGSIIPQHPQKAVEFTRQFSKLYRSMLQLHSELLIDLSDEISFVESYVHLQKVRFEEALQVHWGKLEQTDDYAIPPFALQMVIENAIKHNIVSESKPLAIEIKMNKESLVIENNLQLRKNVQDSTKTGLQNLIGRYALIGSGQPKFITTGLTYASTLPLIPNS